MFKYWLGVVKITSWNKLITALRHISHVTLAEKIKAMTYKGGVGMSIVLILHTYLHTCMYMAMCVWTCTFMNAVVQCTYTYACDMHFYSSK